jgi:hypothetical protein
MTKKSQQLRTFTAKKKYRIRMLKRMNADDRKPFSFFSAVIVTQQQQQQHDSIFSGE